MKILFFIPSMYGGGAERVLKYVMENVNAQEKILCTLESGQKYEIDKSIKYIKLTSLDGRSGYLKKIIYFFVQYIKFFMLIQKEKPDIILSFLERSNIITILTPSKSKKIISIRSFISKKFEDTGIKGKIVKLFYKSIFKYIRYFIVPTQEIKEDLIKNFKIENKHIQVIYNPIDLKKINQLKKEPLDKEYRQIFKNNRVLINVGNLTNPKGQWHLIKIFNQLKKINKDIKLVLLGEGILHNYLVNFARQLKMNVYDYKSDSLNENYDIYFLGFQKNPYKFLYNSKLFVFTSLREGFPNALIEAMACDLPVVSSDCQSGPKEILDKGKYGILLPVLSGEKTGELEKNELVWIKTINEILNDEKKLRYLKQKSIKRVNEFELNKIIKLWNNYLKEVLK